MPVWDSIVLGQAKLPISAFDETRGIYFDGKDILPQISTSSVRENRQGMFDNGFYVQGKNVYWGDSQNASHAQINNEQQFYRNPYGNDPAPLANYSVVGNNLRMTSTRATAQDAANFAHFKGYHVMPDGSQATIADLPSPDPAWDPIREKRSVGADDDNIDVWRFEKYPASQISCMLNSIGRLEMSFGRVELRGVCASGGQLIGNPTFKDYQSIEAYFAALIWALEAIGFKEDINGEPLTGDATHMPANEIAGGVIPEIDGHENFSDSVKLAHSTLHYYANGAQQQSPSSATATADCRSNFITYGWDLTPGKIGFFINDTYTNVLTTPDSIALPKPIYVKDPSDGAKPLLVDGVAQTTGTRKHADGSDFYMRWFFLSNLAVSSNLSRGFYYDYVTNVNLADDVGGWAETAYNEIEYIMVRPLAVDNPDQNGLRIQGVVSDTSSDVTPEITTTGRTEPYIVGVDEMAAHQVRVFYPRLPEGKTPEDYTYLHSVSGDADVSIIGPNNAYPVKIKSHAGSVDEKTFVLQTVLTDV